MEPNLNSTVNQLINIARDLYYATLIQRCDLDKKDEDGIPDSMHIVIASIDSLAMLIVNNTVDQKTIYNELMNEITINGVKTGYNWEMNLAKKVKDFESEKLHP